MNLLEPYDWRSPEQGERCQEESDWQKREDEKEGVQTVEESVGHELLQLPGDPHERVDLLGVGVFDTGAWEVPLKGP